RSSAGRRKSVAVSPNTVITVLLFGLITNRTPSFDSYIGLPCRVPSRPLIVALRIHSLIHSAASVGSMPYRILAPLIARVVGWYSATLPPISTDDLMESTPLPRAGARMKLRANRRRHRLRGIRDMFPPRSRRLNVVRSFAFRQ